MGVLNQEHAELGNPIRFVRYYITAIVLALQLGWHLWKPLKKWLFAFSAESQPCGSDHT